MTIQALWLLRKLKKAQINLREFVYIDDEKMTASTIHAPNERWKTVRLRGYKTSLHSTLRYLKDQKYIDYEEDTVKVLHSGWHLGQAMLSEFFGFLLKSIIVPIGVSLATTLITLWIQGYFSS